MMFSKVTLVSFRFFFWSMVVWFFLIRLLPVHGILPGFMRGIIDIAAMAHMSILFLTLVAWYPIQWAIMKCSGTTDRQMDRTSIPVRNGLYVMTAIFWLLYAIPHAYAGIMVERVWQKWIRTGDNAAFRERDMILDSIGFDTETSLRFWHEEPLVPGIYVISKLAP